MIKNELIEQMNLGPHFFFGVLITFAVVGLIIYINDSTRPNSEN